MVFFNSIGAIVENFYRNLADCVLYFFFNGISFVFLLNIQMFFFRIILK